jgi:uncharacterized protein (TIRG00374 family)
MSSKRYRFALFIFVIWMVGFYLTGFLTGQNLFYGLSRTPLWSLALGYLFYMLAVGTGIFVLYTCLRYVKVVAPISGISKAWIFGSFIDDIVPTITPLGEAGMAYFLDKFYRVSYVRTLAAIGLYVSSWGLSVTIFSALAVFLVNHFINISFPMLVASVFMVLFFALLTVGWLLLITRKDLVQRIVYRIVRFYNRLYNKFKKGKVTFEAAVFRTEFEASYSSLELVMKNKAYVAFATFMLVIPQISHVLCIYAILLGFGIHAPFLAVLMIHILSSVMGLLSFIPSGFGVYEGVSWKAMADFLGPYGVTGQIAFITVFIYRFIFVWTTIFIGGMVGMTQGIGKIEPKIGHPVQP